MLETPFLAGGKVCQGIRDDSYWKITFSSKELESNDWLSLPRIVTVEIAERLYHEIMRIFKNKPKEFHCQEDTSQPNGPMLRLKAARTSLTW